MSISTAVFVLFLAGVANAASDGLVRNFRIASNDGTHVRFSWDIQSGYQSTSNINTFYIYYTYAYPGTYGTVYSISFSPSSTTQTNGGLTFSYTTTVTRFSNAAQYIMWLRVYRSTTPTNLYSEQIYVEIGATIALEMNIKLIEGQTCLDFTSRTSTSTVGSEVYRAVRIYCQCTYDFISSIVIRPGYFDCSTPGYVTYRAYMASSDVTKDPSTLVGALNHWLHDTNNNTIIAGVMKYRVEPGSCGLTVPYTNTPFCAVNTSSKSDVDNSKANIASANTPTQSAQSNNVGSNQTASPENTAVIVSSVFAAMFFILSLGLLAYVLTIKRPARRMSKPTTGAAGNRTGTNPYFTTKSIPLPKNKPAHENIELETYEELDCNYT